MGDGSVPVNIFLLGNEGHGKSSVGNFILNRRTFEISGQGLAPNTRPGFAFGRRGNFTMKVFEMPARSDAPKTQLQLYRQNAREAFDTFDRNLLLFLLVIKFDHENSDNFHHVFDRWREVLGSDIFNNWGVIVVTFGDEFTSLMTTNGTPDKTPSEWWYQHTKVLYNLLKECQQRHVIFNDNANHDEKERTFEDLFNYLPELLNDPYTKDTFNEFTKSQTMFLAQCSKTMFTILIGSVPVVGIVLLGTWYVMMRHK